jgi:aspartate/methionine/tyrosine aminotransferase
MLSERTSWPRTPNRLSAAVEARRKLGAPIVDLTVANPTSCGLRYPERQILTALALPESLSYSPDPRGLLSARKRIVAYYQEKDVLLHPTFVFLTAGTSEGYAMLFRLLCNPGDNVLVPRPSYPLFEYLAHISDVGLRHYALRYDGAWHLDLPSLRSAITAQTRAIVAVHPHNPTGMFLRRDDLVSLVAIAREHNLALIVDEVFLDYGFAADAERAGSTAGISDVLTFTLNGVSKSCALPQMKLGWIVVSGPDQQVIEASERLEILCDTFLSVSTPIQHALPVLFHAGKEVQRQIQARTRANYAFLGQLAGGGSPCSLLAAQGGWYAMLKVPNVKSDEAWALELLEKAGVLVQPGYFFDVEEGACLVVSLLVEEGEFARAAEGVARQIAETGG